MWVFPPRSWCPLVARGRPSCLRGPSSRPRVPPSLAEGLPAALHLQPPPGLPAAPPSIAPAPARQRRADFASGATSTPQAKPGPSTTRCRTSRFARACKAGAGLCWMFRAAGAGLCKAPSHPLRTGPHAPAQDGRRARQRPAKAGRESARPKSSNTLISS